MKPSESLHRPDMKDVGFEEPQTETLFDAKRDITALDIEKCRQALETYRQSRDLWGLVNVANGIKEIDPAFHLLTEITAADREGIQKNLALLLEVSNSENFIYLYLGVKSLDPHFVIDSLNTSKNCSMIRSQYQRHLFFQDWEKCAQYILAFRLLRWGELPVVDIPPDAQEKTRSVLQVIRRQERWYDFAEFANLILDLDPNFEPQAELTDDDIRNMQGTLSMLRQRRSWGDFAVMAGAMNRLARAMQANPSNSDITRTLPETRNF